MKTSRRSIGAVLVLISWGLSLLWLGLRSSGQSESAFLRTQASLQLAESEAWFRVMAGNEQIGTAGISMDTVATGYRIRENLTMHFPSDSSLNRTIRITDYFLTPSLATDSVVSRFTTNNFKDEYRVFSRRDHWQTSYSINGDTATTGTIPFGAESTLAGAPVPVRAVALRLAMVGAIAAGEGRSLSVLAGWPGAASPATIHVGPDTILTFADSSEERSGEEQWEPARLDTVEARSLWLTGPAGGLFMRVDRRGTLVGLESLWGVRWEREEFNIARFNFRARLDTTGATLREYLPRVKELAGSGVALHMPTKPDSRKIILLDGRQLRRELEEPNYPDGLARIRDKERRPVRWSSVLQSEDVIDPLVQADSPEIIALAKEMGPEYTELSVAIRIHEMIAVDTARDGPVDALGTLRSRRGRPEGVARLTAAVLKNLGTPARILLGVLPVDGILYSHAWVATAHTDRSRGISVDPVLGGLASPLLIEIAGAGSSYPQMIWPLVASIKFTDGQQIQPQEE